MSATKRFRFTLLALMIAFGLVIPASTTLTAPAAEAKTDTYYVNDDYVAVPLYFFGTPKSKYLLSTEYFEGNTVEIDVLANDRLGIDPSEYWTNYPVSGLVNHKRGFFGLSQWDPRYKSNGEFVWYNPAQAGKDSFRYEAIDVDGVVRSAYVHVTNVQLKEIIPTALVNGVKLYNPNDTWVYVSIANHTGHAPKGAPDFIKLKARSSYSFKSTAKDLKETFSNGRITYSVTPDRNNHDFYNRIEYEIKPLKSAPKVSAKVKAYGKSKSLRAKVSITNKTSTAVKYRVTYQKKGWKKPHAFVRIIKAKSTKVVNLKSLKSGGKVTVKAKVKRTKSGVVYKTLLSKKIK